MDLPIKRRTFIRLLIVSVALIVGTLSVAPSIFAIHALGQEYKGIPFMYLDDEDYYLARIHEVVDGHIMVGSPFLAEYKDRAPLAFPLGEFFYAAPIAIGIPIDVVVPAAKFLFPALLFLLVYALTMRLVSESDRLAGRATAVAAGLLLTLGFEFTNVGYAVRYLMGSVNSLDLSMWTRPVNPVIGALLLFSSLLLVKKALDTKRMPWFIASGILSGLMLYNYYFSWMMGSAVLLSMFLIHAALKDRQAVKGLFVAGIADLLAAAPYFVSALRSMGSADGASVSARNGMTLSHAPLLNKAVLVAAVFFIGLTFMEWLKTRKLKEIASRPWWVFCASLLLGSLIAFNQQVITGRSLWPYHFVQYSIPFSMIVCLVAIHEVVRPRFRWLWIIATAVCIVAPIAFGIRASTSYTEVLPDFRTVQADASVFAWLDANEPKDCVVLVKEQGDSLNRLIPAFTHCNTYVTRWVFAGVPQERVLHDYYVYLRMNGVTAEDVQKYLEAHPEEVRGYFFDDWQTAFAQGHDAWLIGKESELAEGYAEFLKGDFKTQIHSYHVDVLVSDTVLSEDEQASIGLAKDFGKVGNEYVYGF